jgi:hypothetical protein
MPDSVTIDDLWSEWEELSLDLDSMDRRSPHTRPAQDWWSNAVDPNQRRLFKACQYATAQKEWTDSAAACLEWLGDPDSLWFVREDDRWRGAREQQRQVAWLHLRCAQILATQTPWTSPSLPAEAESALAQAAAAVRAPRNLALDLAAELLTGKLQDALDCRASMLSVNVDARQGEVMTLTVRRVESGTSELYAVPAMDLVRRDQKFNQALSNVRTYVRDKLRLWPDDVDVSWDLLRADAGVRPLELSGDSGGLAFALAIAKVLVSEPEGVEQS